jgi:hypothetical protein
MGCLNWRESRAEGRAEQKSSDLIPVQARDWLSRKRNPVRPPVSPVPGKLIFKEGMLEGRLDPHVQFQSPMETRSFYVSRTSDLILLLIIYVDDLMITGNHGVKISWLQRQLSAQFAMSLLGPVILYLGMGCNLNAESCRLFGGFGAWTRCQSLDRDWWCSSWQSLVSTW